MQKVVFLLLIFSLSFIKVSAQGCDSGSSSTEDDSNKPKLFGFVQSQYEHTFTDEGESTFNFERVRLGASGSIPYDFKYYAVLEASPFMSEGKNAFILDAFVSYTRFKWARVSLGSFKNGFGLETNTACHSLNTVYRSQTVLNLNAPFRDMGVMLMGGDDTTLIKYNLAVLNGSGLRMEDSDNYKDIVGRVVFAPHLLTDSYLINYARIGFSGKYGVSAPFNEEGTPEDQINKDNNKQYRFGADLDLSLGNFVWQTEYIWALDEGATLKGADCTNPGTWVTGTTYQEGFYTQLMYTWRYMYQPLVRYEYYNNNVIKDANSFLTEQYVNNLTFGLNVFFNDNTRLQANYIYNAEMPEEFEGDENMWPYADRFVLQLQIKF